MRDYKNNSVRREGLELFSAIYVATKSFPQDERFGLSSQMMRSALSIPSIIAEGCGRHSNKEFGRFLEIALGSIHELDTRVHARKTLRLLRSSESEIDSRILNRKR
ncbi:MAG: four helix bundle protein [Flavobacteriales bacterium]|nr:four helix bundle protein [Flavobacteriales bacterium]